MQWAGIFFSMIQGTYSSVKILHKILIAMVTKISQVVTNCICLFIPRYFTKIIHTKIFRYTHIFT